MHVCHLKKVCSDNRVCCHNVGNIAFKTVKGLKSMIKKDKLERMIKGTKVIAVIKRM